MQIDLDGDGTSDIVVDGGAARWEATYWLYLRRGACGYPLGVVSSSNGLVRMASKKNGLFDLMVVSDECPSLGGLGGGWCEIVYRFDGKRYGAASERKTTRPGGAAP